MAFRDRLRRLQREARGDEVIIPQVDGTVKRFPQRELRAAFLEDVDRTAGRVGPEVPVHPILTALRSSSDPAPLGLFMGGGDPHHPDPTPDLSE